jgi:hypothetical protein
MKKTNKKFLFVAIALLFVMSIGYAALSTTLTINGTANIASNSWNVHFANIQTTTGSVTPTTAPTVSGTNTTSLTWAVSLAEPGDFYEFTVDAVNGGTINAKIADNGITKTEMTSTQDTYLNYTVTYADGTAIAAGDTLAKAGATGNTKTLKVRVEYDTNVTSEQINALTEPLAVTLNYSLNYVQD